MIVKRIKLVLVDNHQVTVDGLRFLLSKEQDVIIAGQASNGTEALEKIPMLQPDMLIADFSMPEMNGIKLTEIVKEKFPSIKALILSRYEEGVYIKKIIDAGASGYLSKNILKEELVKVIRMIAKSNLYFHTKILQKITLWMIIIKINKFVTIYNPF